MVWIFVLLFVLLFASIAVWKYWKSPLVASKRFALGRWLIKGTGFSVVRIVMRGDSMYVQDVKGTLHKIGRR